MFQDVLEYLLIFDGDIEHVWQTTSRLGFYRGRPVFMSALAGLDIALWDLKDKNPSPLQPGLILA
jgi:L-alanine-DL-glutamate epimerase-like enolase superfamily enzyme